MNNYSNELTYSTIKVYEKQQLARLASNKVVTACIREFKDGLENEVLEFLFGTYIECLEIVSLEDEVFRKIFPKIDDYIATVLYNLYNSSEAIETIVLANGSKLLEIFANLLNYLNQFLGEFHLFEINTLHTEILNLLALFYEYSKTILDKEVKKSSEFLLEFRNFFRNCVRLQNLMVGLIVSDSIKFFAEKEIVDEFKQFVDLLHRLVNVAGRITKLDVKASAELWKCITKLVHNYSENLKSKNYSIPNTFDWLADSAQILCEEIERNLTGIADLSADQLNRNFKINTFYINVLVKFSYYFSAEYFYGSKYILSTVIFCLKLEKCGNSKLGQSVNQHTTIGLLNVLFEIYKNSRFINELHTLADTTDDHNEFVELCLIIVKRIIKEHSETTTNLYFANPSTNMLRPLLFKSIPKSSRAITDNKFYHQIIGYLSNLILCNVDNRTVFHNFETVLVELILQNDFFILGILAIDLWTLVLGNFLQETLYFYFKLWIQFYFRDQRCGRPTIYPAQCFVKILLKNIYNSLRPKFRMQFYSEKNKVERIKIWGLLGLDKIPNANEQLLCIDELYRDVNEQMDKFMDGTLSIREYGEMINHLRLLSSPAKVVKSNEPFQINLNSMLTKIKSFSTIDKFAPLITQLFKSIVVYRNYIDPDTVVSEVKPLYSKHLLLSLKFEIVFLIQKILGHHNAHNTLKEICTNNCEIIVTSLISNSLNSSKSNIVSLINKIDPIKFEHICRVANAPNSSNSIGDDDDDDKFDSNSPKRIKLNSSGHCTTSSSTSKELQDFKKSVDGIELLSRSGLLNRNDITELSRQLERVNRIINNFNIFENFEDDF